MRGVAHGFSAAVGKLGALTADIVLGQARMPAYPVLVSPCALQRFPKRK